MTQQVNASKSAHIVRSVARLTRSAAVAVFVFVALTLLSIAVPASSSSWLSALSSAVQAQNLIANPGFENNPPGAGGNNIGHPIAPWVLGAGDTPNVVKVDGDATIFYGAGGPAFDALAPSSGTQQHYLDILGTNEFYQAFTVPTCSNTALTTTAQYTLSGFFSTRDNLSGSGNIAMLEGAGLAGAVVPGSELSVTLPANTTNTFPLWSNVSATVPLNLGQTYSYRGAMGDNLNFDEASLTLDDISCPELSLNKTTTSTPTQAAYMLDYSFEVTNTSPTNIAIWGAVQPE